MADCPTEGELEAEGGVTVQLRAFCPEDQEHGQTLHLHHLLPAATTIAALRHLLCTEEGCTAGAVCADSVDFVGIKPATAEHHWGMLALQDEDIKLVFLGHRIAADGDDEGLRIYVQLPEELTIGQMAEHGGYL